MAYSSEAIQRFYRRFNDNELRPRPGQIGVKFPRKPPSKARSFRGTRSFVGTSLSVMQTRTTHNATSRLTGSLAFSIAYGIRVDNLDNEFLRTYTKVLHDLFEAMVPGTFLIDVLPFRESNRLGGGCGREMTDDNLPQSSIYLRGSPVHDSTESQTRLTAASTWPKPAQWSMFRSNSRFGGSDHYGCMRTPTDSSAQLGGGIDASITSVCLENLETLNKKGVDMEVIYNTLGILYGGTSLSPIACPPSNCFPQEWQTQ
jgi:hypothetical protein